MADAENTLDFVTGLKEFCDPNDIERKSKPKTRIWLDEWKLVFLRYQRRLIDGANCVGETERCLAADQFQCTVEGRWRSPR